MRAWLAILGVCVLLYYMTLGGIYFSKKIGYSYTNKHKKVCICHAGDNTVRFKHNLLTQYQLNAHEMHKLLDNDKFDTEMGFSQCSCYVTYLLFQTHPSLVVFVFAFF